MLQARARGSRRRAAGFKVYSPPHCGQDPPLSPPLTIVPLPPPRRTPTYYLLGATAAFCRAPFLRCCPDCLHDMHLCYGHSRTVLSSVLYSQSAWPPATSFSWGCPSPSPLCLAPRHLILVGLPLTQPPVPGPPPPHSRGAAPHPAPCAWPPATSFSWGCPSPSPLHPSPPCLTLHLDSAATVSPVGVGDN